jgi:hypothetical protein
MHSPSSGQREVKESGQMTVSSVAFSPRQWPAHPEIIVKMHSENDLPC